MNKKEYYSKFNLSISFRLPFMHVLQNNVRAVHVNTLLVLDSSSSTIASSHSLGTHFVTAF